MTEWIKFVLMQGYGRVLKKSLSETNFLRVSWPAMAAVSWLLPMLIPFSNERPGGHD